MSIPQRFDLNAICSATPISACDLNRNEMIIVIMGPSGVGKTTFIETVLEPYHATLGAELQLRSTQSGINALRIMFKNSEQQNLVLVDTPGFDDARRTDWEVLQAIVRWLIDVGTNDSRARERTVVQRVSAFLWLHSITDTDFFFSTTTNFDIFTRFCGKNFHERIIFTTTMWPENNVKAEECRNREQEFKGTQWKSMIDSGSKVHHFTRTLRSAQEIVNLVVEIEAKRPSRDLPHRPMVEVDKGVLHEEKRIPEHREKQENMGPSRPRKPPPTSLQTFSRRNFDNIETAMPVTVEDLNDDDMIIAIMGPTGAGKSTFIQIITGPYFSNEEVGHQLHSATNGVRAVRVIFKADDTPNLVFVDTPGFDDTYKTDYQILDIISGWLAYSPKGKRLKISGILYLHNITETRIPSSVSKNFEMFQKLCGEDFYNRVILITTMWPDENAFTYKPEEQAEYEKRNKELVNDYWDVMIKSGSKVFSFLRTSHSAEDIVNEIANAERNAQVRTLNEMMKIQKELVDEHKTLPHTQAGRHLHRLLQDLVGRQNVLLGQLMEELERSVQQDPRAVGGLLDELKSLQQEIEKSKKDTKKLKTSPIKKLITRLQIHYSQVLAWFRSYA